MQHCDIGSKVASLSLSALVNLRKREKKGNNFFSAVVFVIKNYVVLEFTKSIWHASCN